MSNKKSYMNKNNLLSEGFFDIIKKYLIQYPKLAKDKKFTSALNDLNKGTQKFADLLNADIKKHGFDMKPVKYRKYKTSDFLK
tara:strand:- start:263 stop:511 length:249 start_codon:yes stop_codon:yes gene_type:complete